MAAIVAEGDINPDAFATFIKKNLPLYSIPMFIRFQKGGTEITATFKHKKVDLRDEGMDVTKVSDPMWWYNAATATCVFLVLPLSSPVLSSFIFTRTFPFSSYARYEPFTMKAYQDVITGASRL
jgi:hypothetical protein